MIRRKIDRGPLLPPHGRAPPRMPAPPQMNRGEGCASFAAIYFESFEAFENDERPGGYTFVDQTSHFGPYLSMWVRLKGREQIMTGALCLNPMPPGLQKPDAQGKLRPASWGFNGNRTKPTLTPSIKYGDPADPYYWHGFLTDGEFKGC